MKSRKAKAVTVAPASARYPTMIAQVSHPTLPGYTERVERVVDTLALMRQRKHINERCYLTAEKYRHAHETIYSQVGSAMDFDRGRGSFNPNMPRPLAYSLAAEMLTTAKRMLYVQQYTVVHLVCAEGWTIDACARRMFGVGPDGKVRQCHRKECGRFFRDGLLVLADIWFPEPVGEGSRLRTYRPRDSRPTECEEGEIEPSASIHIGQKIFRANPQRAA